MALSATTVWEIRTTGNAANAGGFNPSGGSPGTDYSQQDSPQVTIDGSTITATVNATTTLLDIVGYTVAATDNRNLIRIAGGTMTAGTYEITAVDTVNNRWTIDRSGGTAGQTGTGRMGGAQSDPALVAAVAVASNYVHQKSGTYSITSASTNVAGGCITLAGKDRVIWEGYQTTRGDLGTAPLLQASGISTAVLFTYGANYVWVQNVDTDGASLTSIRGFASTIASTVLRRCRALNCTNSGIAASGRVIACLATGCGTQPAILMSTLGGYVFGSVAHANTVTGIRNDTGYVVASLSYDNSGATSDGFADPTTGGHYINCTAYNNGRNGFRVNAGALLINCVAEANATAGYHALDTSVWRLFCAGFNTTDTAGSTMRIDKGFITGTGTFFVDAAAGNFALNRVAGGGAAVRAAGYPGEFPAATTEGFLDLGAAQSAPYYGEAGYQMGVI